MTNEFAQVYLYAKGHYDKEKKAPWGSSVKLFIASDYCGVHPELLHETNFLNLLENATADFLSRRDKNASASVLLDTIGRTLVIHATMEPCDYSVGFNSKDPLEIVHQVLEESCLHILRFAKPVDIPDGFNLSKEKRIDMGKMYEEMRERVRNN